MIIKKIKSKLEFSQFTYFISILIAISFSSCATSLSKSVYSLKIASEPDSAFYTIVDRRGNKTHSGLTPDTIDLKANAGYFQPNEYYISVKKQGYLEANASIYFVVDGTYFLNFPFFNLFGLFLIDPITGAMWKPDKQEVQIILIQEK